MRQSLTYPDAFKHRGRLHGRKVSLMTVGCQASEPRPDGCGVSGAVHKHAMGVAGGHTEEGVPRRCAQQEARREVTQGGLSDGSLLGLQGQQR